jgi:hypothetical protein
LFNLPCEEFSPESVGDLDENFSDYVSFLRYFSALLIRV